MITFLILIFKQKAKFYENRYIKNWKSIIFSFFGNFLDREEKQDNIMHTDPVLFQNNHSLEWSKKQEWNGVYHHEKRVLQDKNGYHGE